MKDSAGIVLASALQLAFAVHPKYVKEVDMNDRKQSRFLNLCPLFPNLAALYNTPKLPRSPLSFDLSCPHPK
jgi:hypothetical protein